MLRAACFLLLVSVPFLAAARAQPATLRALVVEAETQRPLPGATVVLLVDSARVAGGVTDGDGLVLLPRLAPRTYAVQVSYVGFAPVVDTLALAAGAVVEQRFALAEAEAALGELVVEAEGASGIVAVTAGVQRVRPADIERVPVPGASGDLAAYVQTVPGVAAVGDRGGQLFVQGGRPSQNLTLLDGLPVVRPFHIVGFYSAFPSDVVDTTTLAAGGFGAQHGGRLSSVLDVATRAGSKERFAGSVALAPFLSGAYVEGPLVPGRVSVLASARESLVERLTPRLYGQAFPYRFGDRFAKVHARLGVASSLAVSALQTHDEGAIAGSKTDVFGDPVPFVEDDETLAWDNLAVGADLDLRPVRLPWRLRVQGGYTESSAAFGPADAPRQTAATELWTGTATLGYLLGPHTVRLGGFAWHGRYRYDLGTLFRDVPARTEDAAEVGGFLEGEAALGAVRAEGGVRLHVYGAAGAVSVEPRLRLAWQPAGVPAVREVALAGGVYRQGVVGLTDERNLGNVLTAYVPVAEGTVLPTAYHAVASWRGDLAPGVTLAAEGFAKVFPDLLAPDFPALVTATTTLEAASGTAYGLSLRGEVRRPFVLESTLRLTGSYVLSTVEVETDAEAYAPPHDQRHRLHAVARVERGGYALMAQFQYSSGFPFTPSAGIDDWLPLLGRGEDVSAKPGQTRLLYGPRGGARLPAYHRLDLWAERAVERGRYRFTLRAGVVNAYNRANVFYFDLFTFRRVDQFPLLPSVGVKLDLR